MGVLGAAIGAVGSIAGGVLGSGILGGGGGSTPSVKLKTIDLPDVNAGLWGYINEAGSFPGVAGFTNQINQTAMQQYTQMLNQLYPGATKQLGQISNLAQSYMQGQIPQDVQSQIQRATAQQALTGGYGGTGMASNLTARDFGQTSMNLQQQGVGLYGAGLNAAKSMIPGFINPGQLLFSPAQILARDDQKNYYNNEVQNQQQIINAGMAQQANAMQMAQQAKQQSSLGGIFSGLFGSASNPSGLSTGLAGSIGNFFSGGGGGGGGGSSSGWGFLGGEDTLSNADLVSALSGF